MQSTLVLCSLFANNEHLICHLMSCESRESESRKSKPKLGSANIHSENSPRMNARRRMHGHLNLSNNPIIYSELVFSVKFAKPYPPAELAAKANVRFKIEPNAGYLRGYSSSDKSSDEENLLKRQSINFKFRFFKHISGPGGGLQSEEPIEDDTLSVNLTVTIYTVDDKPIVQLPSLVATFQKQSLQKMTQDFRTFFQEAGSKKDAPTEIVCKDGTQFKVYRGILCARSPVFRTMFQTEMSEADSGQVRIEDIPSKALDVFLHFLRTGELKDNWKELGILEGLTYAAHKYDVKDLFEFLDQSLSHLVNQENCGKLMNLAKKVGVVQAKKELMDYFKREVTSIEQAAQIVTEAMSVLDLCPVEPETGN